MSGPKWEDLNMDCLVNVFERVGMESLLLDVPFVCKSWYRATLNPQCWRSLVFPKMHDPANDWGDDEFASRLKSQYQIKGNLNVTAFIKSVVKRSDKSVTYLSFLGLWTDEALLYVADECLGLRVLELHDYIVYGIGLSSSMTSNLMSKLKNLEILRLGGSSKMQEVLAQISIHCKNFVGLAVTSADIWKDEALSIVTLLPNIMYLDLRAASMKKENLVMILQGCKELVYFDARDCTGFDEGDDEILELASHISTFMHEGSISYHKKYYHPGYPSFHDVYSGVV